MRNSVAFSVLPLFAATAIAQIPSPVSVLRAAPRATWERVTTSLANEIPQRADMPGAASNDRVYLFGGCSGNNTSVVLNDLYEFDGISATPLLPAGTLPPARGRHACAWNSATNKLVIYGGNDRGATNNLLGDIWEYDPVANAWTDVTPTTGPAPTARQHASMAWDPITTGMLVFGGQDSLTPTYSSETWLFLGNTWVQMSPTNVPSARSQASLCTRTDFNDIFLCGGIDGNSATDPRKLDAWAWTGADWTLLNAGVPGVNSFPASVNANQAVYDPIRQRVVMQGGQGIGAGTGTLYQTAIGNEYGGSPSQYTNEFDCLTNEWTLYANPQVDNTTTTNYEALRDGLDSGGVLGRNSRYAAAFLPSTGKIYKLAGQRPNYANSNPLYIFEYQASPIATSTSNGTGCTGAGGPMSMVANDDPWTGRNWHLTGSGFPALALGFGVVGFGTQNTPLQNLFPLAGAGCNLLVNNDAILLLLPSAGQASLSLGIPSDPVFSGITLNTQMLSLELNASSVVTGLTSTNAIAGAIGAL
ncbi:MAG: hypothetical protein KDC98_25610 [Planctomycetes bacterium]|nr:hypothetical protein [Planctomycetota bacterium]